LPNFLSELINDSEFIKTYQKIRRLLLIFLNLEGAFLGNCKNLGKTKNTLKKLKIQFFNEDRINVL
jgi:hypothetical protein